MLKNSASTRPRARGGIQAARRAHSVDIKRTKIGAKRASGGNSWTTAALALFGTLTRQAQVVILPARTRSRSFRWKVFAMTIATATPGKTRVGWIGTGVMGAHMVGHLIKAGY